MRPHGSPTQLEQRRLKAVELEGEGLNHQQIARRLNTTDRSVRRWLRARRTGGGSALAARPSPGRPSKLSRRRRQALVRLVLKGAMACGYPTDLWTCPRILDMIRHRFGVSYHVDHLPRLLKDLGFSCQKPQSRAIERDEQAIQRWISKDWPRIKKGLHAEGPG